MSGLTITKHAYRRAKERCGLNQKALKHLISIAETKGLRRKDLNGRLEKWVSGIDSRYVHNSDMIIYGEFLFIFSLGSLVTIYLVPNELKNQARILSKKKRPT